MVSIFNNKEEIATHATNIFVTAAQNAIQKRGRFVVALTGGSSPVAIYLAPPYKAKIDWQNVCFLG
jgi:6-phosphogluconolactonase